MTRNGMPHTNDVSEPRGESADQDPVSMGRSAFLAGDVERAKRFADEAISSDPLRQDAWILKGRALVCRFDPTGAKECYQQALDIDDRNPETWKRKGFAHRVDGEAIDYDAWPLYEAPGVEGPLGLGRVTLGHDGEELVLDFGVDPDRPLQPMRVIG